MKKRIDYIDGLKGLCALFVSMYHFILVGYFGGYVGFGTNFTKTEAVSNVCNNFLSAFITNNSAGLYIFLVLIAVFPVISFRKKGSKAEVMGRYACKRYFQLLPLCFITSILMVILYNGGFIHFDEMAELFENSWIATTNPDHTNILQAIKVMLFDAWFINTREVGALWCLHIIFRGSLMTYAAYGLFGNSKIKYLPTIVLFIISLQTNYYILFAFGSILGELLANDKELKQIPLIISILLLIIGILIIKIPNVLYPIQIDATINGGLGSCLIIFSVLKCEKLQSFFSNKVLTFLGKVSFEIVIGHVFIMGILAYPISVWLLTKMEVGFCFSLLLGIICTLLSIPFAYLLGKFITPLGSKLAKKVEAICFVDTSIK